MKTGKAITLNSSNIDEFIKNISEKLPKPRYDMVYLHPRDYFEIKYPELTNEAVELNSRHGKSIWDKRTKGWKHIKQTYLDLCKDE